MPLTINAKLFLKPQRSDTTDQRQTTTRIGVTSIPAALLAEAHAVPMGVAADATSVAAAEAKIDTLTCLISPLGGRRGKMAHIS
jgi:hypothetical protein